MELAKRFPFDGQSVSIHPKSDHTGPVTDIVHKGQFTSKLTGKKVNLGICSFGDDKSILGKHFLPFVVDDQCEVIVVACHNLVEVIGNTYNFIDEVAFANDYRLISTSILRDDNARWKKAGLPLHHENNVNNVNGVNINEIFADNLINLITSIV